MPRPEAPKARRTLHAASKRSQSEAKKPSCSVRQKTESLRLRDQTKEFDPRMPRTVFFRKEDTMRTILMCMIAVGALACATTETKDPTPVVEPTPTEPTPVVPEATPPAAEPAPATP